MEGMENLNQAAGAGTEGQGNAKAADPVGVAKSEEPAGKPEGKEPAAGQAAEQEAEGQDYVQKLREKFEEEKKEAVKSALEEAKKIAAMKPEEVKEYEGRKREEELEKREKELRLRELKNDTKDILHEKGIPAGFAEFLIGADIEQTKANIGAFKKEFDLAVQAQVEQRMKGTTPKIGSGRGSGGITEEIEKYL